MKVLQINAVSGIRSTGRLCTEISDYLNNNGNEGYIAYSKGISYSKGYKIGTILDGKMHGLWSRIFGMQAYFSKNSTRKLLVYISDLNPDIVHLHNLHGNFINLEIILNYLAQKDIPTVITLHDCWFFTGKCTHYTIDKCYKWQTECDNCPRLKNDNPSWFFDQTAKMYNDKKNWFNKIPRLAVIGVSDWITNEARKSFLAPANIVTRIYNWIDLDVFRPHPSIEIKKRLGIEDKFVILGVASAWSDAKGLHQFIKLAKMISTDILIILIGGMNKNINLPDNILHIPETHEVSELVKYYSLADVYLHLSLEETFGKTIAEAMACGTPAIVYDSTACPELIAPGCGYVVIPNDLKGIFSTIQKIKLKGKSYFSENCRQHVMKNFNYITNVNKIVGLYCNISNQ